MFDVSYKNVNTYKIRKLHKMEIGQLWFLEHKDNDLFTCTY